MSAPIPKSLLRLVDYIKELSTLDSEDKTDEQLEEDRQAWLITAKDVQFVDLTRHYNMELGAKYGFRKFPTDTTIE